MILSIYLSEDLSDKNLIKISIHITELLDSNNDLDSSVNKKILRIIFKIKKYYIICVQNKKSINFNISKIVAKNTLIYKIFNKKDWE